MDLENGNPLKVIFMKVNGYKIGNREREFLNIVQAHIKDNL